MQHIIRAPEILAAIIVVVIAIFRFFFLRNSSIAVDICPRSPIWEWHCLFLETLTFALTQFWLPAKLGCEWRQANQGPGLCVDARLFVQDRSSYVLGTKGALSLKKLWTASMPRLWLSLWNLSHCEHPQKKEDPLSAWPSAPANLFLPFPHLYIYPISYALLRRTTPFCISSTKPVSGI